MGLRHHCIENVLTCEYVESAYPDGCPACAVVGDKPAVEGDVTTDRECKDHPFSVLRYSGAVFDGCPGCAGVVRQGFAELRRLIDAEEPDDDELEVELVDINDA